MKGLLAGFDSEQALEQAMERLSSAGVGETETYTPRPMRAVVAAQDSGPEDDGPSGSPLPLVMFIAGMAGFIGFFLLMAYADIRAYPLDIGGRPAFAWPAFIPIAFELGVLCAMAAGFFGYFVVCRMPQLYDPIDSCGQLREASRDGWFVAVRTADDAQLERVRGLLRGLAPSSVEEFAA
jgi:ActD protein